MQKKTSRFERIRLEEVSHLLKKQKNAERESEQPFEDQPPKTVRQNPPGQANNVQKHRARPKRSIRTEGEDHPLGLWIDKDIFRKHQNPAPQMVLHDPAWTLNNRYIALADLALGTNKKKRSSVELKARP